MTSQPRLRATPPATADDGKPTQINEHKRAEQTRVNEHEPHAMASRRCGRRESGRAQ